MNLLEHYIKEVHFVKDVTKKISWKPKEPIYAVELTYDCYGAIGRKIMHFRKSEWEKAQKNGYFMA